MGMHCDKADSEERLTSFWDAFKFHCKSSLSELKETGWGVGFHAYSPSAGASHIDSLFPACLSTLALCSGTLQTRVTIWGLVCSGFRPREIECKQCLKVPLEVGVASQDVANLESVGYGSTFYRSGWDPTCHYPNGQQP